MLDIDITRDFNDLMTYLARYLHAVERNPDDWLENAETPKQTVNNDVRGRSNKADSQHTSSNHVENTSETISTAKSNDSTHNPAATRKFENSHHVCDFCRTNGHVMWRCNKYLKAPRVPRGFFYHILTLTLAQT